MIRRATRQYTKEEVLSVLDPLVSEWFESHFDDLTPPQRYAVIPIHEGKNVLVSSPTGSGKCITSDQQVLIELDGLVQLVRGEEIISKAKTVGKLLARVEGGELYFIPSLRVFSLKEMNTVKIPAFVFIQDYQGEILVIETEAGRKIKVTPDHPLLVATADGFGRWIPAKELRVGDMIAVIRRIDYQSSRIDLPLGKAIDTLRKNFAKVLTYSDYVQLREKISKSGFQSLNDKELNLVRVFCRLSYSKIAKLTGIGTTTVWKFFRGETSYGRELIIEVLKRAFPKDIERNRLFVLLENGSIDTFKYPESVTEEVVKWISFVLSEGHIQSSRVKRGVVDSISVSQSKNVKLLREFLEISKQLFGIELTQKNERDWNINSRAFCTFVSVYLDLQPCSREKRKIMPRWILNLDKDLMRTFLRWFISLDAEIGTQIALAQASRDVIDKISFMLLRFGIFPCLGEQRKYASNTPERKRETYHLLYIHGKENLKKFYEKIGLERDPPLKFRTKLETKSSGDHLFKFLIDLKYLSEIPKSLNMSWDIFEERYGNIYEVARRTGKITLNAANKLYELLKEDCREFGVKNLRVLDYLEKIRDSDILYLRIRKIQRVSYKGKLIDFTVPNLQNFIGGRGGIVLHNTLTAFIGIISELLSMARKGELEDFVYAIYVSPLRALDNDIYRNLKVPLEEIRELAKKKGIELPEIRHAVRTGDTSTSERQKMLRKPPHILITTPETLAITLVAPKFREKFRSLRWVIVDEIHSLVESKRGVHLSLSLERLEHLVGRPFVRIGLSATINPLEEVAKFLVGYKDGKPRYCLIVDTTYAKKMDLHVMAPVPDLIYTPFGVINEEMYKYLCELIRKHRTTLIFTNTRSGAERVAFRLRQLLPLYVEEIEKDDIAAHHGSLSRTVRHDVEEKLKSGELRAIVSSTSLELGIDIGYIDLVVQLGSPKSVTRAIQRVGRAGHRLGEVSKGVFICSDRDDAVEVAIMLKEAMSGHLDRAHMPRNALDVLAQHIAGMAIEQKWNVEEAYELVRRAYPYKDLDRKDFERVLRYLSGAYSQMEMYKVYGKIWYDPDEGVFGRRGKLARAIYSQNVGTIPDEVRVRVRTLGGKKLGSIEEEFLERLMPGDRFVLGGKVYEFVKTVRGFTAVVMPAYDEKPTVPSWFSEMLPLSYDLALEISRFRGKMFEWLEKGVRGQKIVDWIMKNCRADHNIANAILQYFTEEWLYLKSRGVRKYPSDRVLMVEVFVDEDGKKYVVYHALFGRRVNDALSRAVAYLAGRRVRRNLGIIVGDHGFAIVYPPGVQVHHSYLMDIKPEDLPSVLKKAVERTELFERRFRHVATRGLMLLRRYKGTETSIRRRQFNAKKILEAVRELREFPMVKETFREILEDFMDVKNAMEVLRKIRKGEIQVVMLRPTKVPSPFAHNIVLQGMSDIVLMESRRQMLARLHNMVMKVIQRESYAIQNGDN